MSPIDSKIDKLIYNLKNKENHFTVYNKYLERNSKKSFWIYKNILLTKLDLTKKNFINDHFYSSRKLNKIKKMSSLINAKINQSSLNNETKIEIKDIIKAINNFYFFSSKEKFFFDLIQNNNFRDKIGKYGKCLIDLLSEIISNSNLNDKSYQFVKSNLLNSKESNDYILLKLKTDGFFKLDEKIDNFVIEKILYKMTHHKNSYSGSRSGIVKIREEHIGIADYYLNKNNLSKYKKTKLIHFKAHNLSLLLVWYLYKINYKKFIYIFKTGLNLRGPSWFVDIIKCPVSEIFYRISVKKWL